LLGLRPRNVYAASSDTVAANDDLEAMTPRYPSIRVPIGILYGRGDRILDPRAQGEAMKEKIPGLDFELVDGGHMLPVTAPDTVAAFIRRIAKAQAETESSFS